jgi:hypothetical protein
MGGRPVAGNLAGVDTRASRGGGIWGKRGMIREPVCQRRRCGNGWQAESRVEMGWGRHRAGPAAEKTAHKGFSILNPFFQLN